MTCAIRPHPMTPTLNRSVNAGGSPHFKFRWNVPPEANRIGTRCQSVAIVWSRMAVTYKSPLHEMTQTTPTCLWNDSADLDELRYAIDNGAVGATCNPVIAVTILKKHLGDWTPRIHALMDEMPGATEDAIGWRLVEEMSIQAAKLLEPAFAAHRGRNGRLSIQTDPRYFRDTEAILDNALRFNRLPPNILVKYPATKEGT